MRKEFADKIDQLEKRMDSLDLEVGTMNSKLENKIDNLELKINAADAKLENRIDHVNLKIDLINMKLANVTDNLDRMTNNVNSQPKKNVEKSFEKNTELISTAEDIKKEYFLINNYTITKIIINLLAQVATFITIFIVAENLYSCLRASRVFTTASISGLTFGILGVNIIVETMEWWVNNPIEYMRSIQKGRWYMLILGCIIILEAIFIFDGSEYHVSYGYAAIIELIIYLAFKVCFLIDLIRETCKEG